MNQDRNQQQGKTGNLGQKDAQSVKQKESELSRMGEKTQDKGKQQSRQTVEDDESPE